MEKIKIATRKFLELSKSILEKEYYLHFRIQGLSMYPFLQENDVVYVKKVKTPNINTGDIIFYRTPSSKGIVHRIIKRIKKNDKFIFITKGDANPYFDGIVDERNILGRVELIERDGRIIRINNGTFRLRSTIYSKLAFLKIRFCPILRQFKNKILGNLLRRVQNFKAYRYLAKKFIDVEKINYRLAERNDGILLAQIYRIYLWSSKKLEGLVEAFDQGLKKPEDFGYCLLAQSGKKIIGCITIKKFPKRGSYEYWMFGPFVKWCYRRIGIGEQLTKFALQKAKEMGGVEVKTYIFKRNLAAYSLLKKLGGKVISSEIFPSELLYYLNNSYNSYHVNKKLFDVHTLTTFVLPLDQ